MKKEVVIVLLLVGAVIAFGLFYASGDKDDKPSATRTEAKTENVRHPESRLDKFLSDRPKNIAPPASSKKAATPARVEGEPGTALPLKPEFGHRTGPADVTHAHPVDPTERDPIVEYPKVQPIPPIDLIGPGAEHGDQVLEDAADQAEDIAEAEGMGDPDALVDPETGEEIVEETDEEYLIGDDDSY